MTAIPTDALDAFTTAIQGLQTQMAVMNFHLGDLATRVSAIDSRALPSLPAGGATLALPAFSAPPLLESAATASPAALLSTATPSASLPLAPAASTLPPTTGRPFGIPINQICFPHSSSPVPTLESILRGPIPVASAPLASPTSRPHVLPEPEGLVVPKYHKLIFPSFDGKEDPIGSGSRRIT